MQANEVREKYLKFFEKRGHKRIDPALLVLKEDPTTLFTSSGMQPLVPYLMGKDHPEGKRLVDSQPSLRAQDIEEIGDNRHQTLFEMLGNWSLGDYFKKEQIPWFYEFMTGELGLPKDKLYVTVFEGNDQVPKDEETHDLWKSLGIAEDHIYFYGDKKNWWSRAGTPDQMPDGEIGGPDSEVFFEFGSVKHDKKFGDKCHPNCDCGRFLEIGNSVFMQYKKQAGKLVALPKKNVDFGGGLERLTAATNNNPDTFSTDLFSMIIEEIEKASGKSYGEEKNKGAIRVVADHMKAATFLIKSGVVPSNKYQGYILRRLLRRAALKMRDLKGEINGNVLAGVLDAVVSTYKGVYFDEKDNVGSYKDIVREEVGKFAKNVEKGLSKMEKVRKEDINAKFAFDLFQSEGFPFEITQELAAKKGVRLLREEFEKEMEKHQNISREGSGVFKIK
ncbi:MAG TPA: alanine--tRNA ligase-related protein [Patescibacteria group bacterium]